MRAFVHELVVTMSNADDELTKLSVQIAELAKLLDGSQRAASINETRLAHSQDILSENQRYISETQASISDGFANVIGNQKLIVENQHTIIANQNTIISLLKMIVNAEE